jgi:hypothetical protein
MSRPTRICACFVALLAALLAIPLAFAQEAQAPNPAAIAGAMTTFLVIGVVFYVFLALALQTIAEKTGTPNAWLAWIPIANVILMLNIAKKPVWWILLLLIPVVNIIVSVMVWMAVAEVRQKPSWWGILTIIPVLNLIAIGYLAWSD